MTARLAHIYRHPIKSHGRESLAAVHLTEGQTMPWDRRWAVTHAHSKWDQSDPRWLACVNFLVGSGVASLMAITARLDEAGPDVVLTHPDRPDLAINPDAPGDQARFIDWVAPILPQDRAATGLVTVPGRGMTDTDYPSVSICNIASNAALGDLMGAELSPLRWRGNLWVDGWDAWAEGHLLGKRVRIGAAEFDLREPIKRCKATTANPVTGRSDIDTLAGLRAHTGAQDFGVYAVVVRGGLIRSGDPVEMVT